jgi:hypothetical protein
MVSLAGLHGRHDALNPGILFLSHAIIRVMANVGLFRHVVLVRRRVRGRFGRFMWVERARTLAFRPRNGLVAAGYILS